MTTRLEDQIPHKHQEAYPSWVWSPNSLPKCQPHPSMNGWRRQHPSLNGQFVWTTSQWTQFTVIFISFLRLFYGNFSFTTNQTLNFMWEPTFSSPIRIFISELARRRVGCRRHHNYWHQPLVWYCVTFRWLEQDYLPIDHWTRVKVESDRAKHSPRASPCDPWSARLALRSGAKVST